MSSGYLLSLSGGEQLSSKGNPCNYNMCSLVVLDLSPKAEKRLFYCKGQMPRCACAYGGGQAELGCNQVFYLLGPTSQRVVSLPLLWNTWVVPTPTQQEVALLVRTAASEVGSNSRRKTGLHLDVPCGEQFQAQTRKYPVRFLGPAPLSHI